MSKLNGILFFRIIFSWSYIYREKIFIAIRDLYGEMENLEDKFQNNLKRINNKVVKLSETRAVKKFVGLQLKR